MRTDGQTYRHNESVTFRNFANAPTNLELPYWSPQSMSYRTFHLSKDIFPSRLKEYMSLGVKCRGQEADHSCPAKADVKHGVGLYLHSPIRLHGFVITQPERKFYFTKGVCNLMWIKYRCTVWHLLR
jgi:hypothetical protein